MGVELKLDAPRPVVVPGDRDELARVAENLIENAIKYGAPTDAGRRSSSLALGAAARLLASRDHGPGIAPEHLPRLTERFYRVDAGKSRAKGGTGLGLAIVKHIVARHRGRLAIDSAPGEGRDVSRVSASDRPGQSRNRLTRAKSTCIFQRFMLSFRLSSNRRKTLVARD